MRFAIILPIYDPDNLIPDIIQKCLLSVIQNLYNAVIIPIINVEGFPRAVNLGLKRAEKTQANYFIICNDDLEIQDPHWLEKLAQPNVISSWRQHPFFMTQELVPDGALWCMPRNIFNKLGYLDERFNFGYGFEDSDYWFRAKQFNIPFYNARIKVKHLERTTFKKYHKDTDKMLRHNQRVFIKKWQLKSQ